MINLKIYFKHCIGLAGLILILSSCNSLLDKTPLTEYSSENFWKEPAQASAALNGAFTRMQLAFNTEFAYYGEGRADFVKLNVSNTNNTIAVLNNALDPTLSFADWGNFYQVIKQCNLIIARLPVMKDKGMYNASNIAEYNRVLGQAYGLRGYVYFYMSRIWGKLPMVIQPVDEPVSISEFRTPRVDTAEIYKQVSYDLYTAQNLLPSTHVNPLETRAGLTKGGINAILTDYYMWRNNLDSALITSALLIKPADGTPVSSTYKLTNLYNPNINYLSSPQAALDDTEYSKMFTQGFSTESIFEIDYNYLEQTTSGLAGLYSGQGTIPQFNASERIVQKFDDPNDLRALVDLVANSTGNNSDYKVYKFVPKGPFDRVTQNDKSVILYRLADIMLLRAEALNKKGQRAAAFTLVNLIRARAGAAAIPAADDPLTPSVIEGYNNFTVDQAEDFILDERARELCFEGKRWYDLIRTGKVFSVMAGINANPLVDPENLLWPISLNVLRQNPQIEQNNYYK